MVFKLLSIHLLNLRPVLDDFLVVPLFAYLSRLGTTYTAYRPTRPRHFSLIGLTSPVLCPPEPCLGFRKSIRPFSRATELGDKLMQGASISCCIATSTDDFGWSDSACHTENIDSTVSAAKAVITEEDHRLFFVPRLPQLSPLGNLGSQFTLDLSELLISRLAVDMAKCDSTE